MAVFRRAAVIITVERIKKGAILAYKCSLSGGGTCINAQVTIAFVSRTDPLFLTLISHVMTLIEGIIVILCGKRGSIRSTSKSICMDPWSPLTG